MVSGLSSTVNYVYDDANRLTSVNGVNYTWDNNGNLLNDGVNAYTYNAANQLKTMTGPSVNASYAYNGMGDRLQETHNGGTTTFTMDLNMGLTQVLNDGTNNYIYGNGRIAQVNTGTDYFLGDALGSVRQLTNNSGAITYASAYDPYGVTTQAYGASQTAYGFTGEYTSNDLVYLRARMYSPGMGRFLTRDTWGGNENIPITYNRWQYANANPIMYTDPSGHCIFGIDTVFCIAVLIGVPIMAGITTASYDYYQTQDHRVGGRNEFNPACVDWGQVFGAGKFGTFGAIESFANIPLGIPQLVLKYGYGIEPTDANMAWLSYIGLDDEYRAANANPYYVAGREGGNIGALALSLHMLLAGSPTLSVGPGAVSNGGYTSVLSGTNVTAVGGDLSLVYTGTSGLTSSGLSMMSNSGWGNSSRRDLASLARAYAEKIIKTTKPKNRPSTIAVLETSDGQIYYGQSGLGEPPDAALLKIIRNHEHNFGCAEVNCLNQALRFNPPESLRGARITSLAIRGSASNPDIYFQPPCTNGCAILLESLGITIVR